MDGLPTLTSSDDTDAESKASGNRANIPARIRRKLDIDDGTLPAGVVLEFVLEETLNGLPVNAGQEAAFDDDFDRAEDVYRLDTATDPCGP